MAQSFPPSGYILAKSAIEGIEVYAPAPEKEEQEAVVDFKCPQCGATTAYSIEDGGLKCGSCGYYEPPAQEVVGKGAEEFEFKVETLQQAAHGWGEARKQIECQNCQAVTVLVAGQLTAQCPFCSSSKVIQGDANQSALRPRFVIPFKLEEQACYPITDKWLGSSWMTPSKLRRMAKLGEFNGIYLPFWTFDARTNAQWKAEVGYDETEHYYQDGERKSRTVTKWRWESGSVSHFFDDLLITGTTHVSDGVLGVVNNFQLSELAAYEPGYLAGWQAQAYDITLEKAWDAGRGKMREHTRQLCREDALSGSADHVRNMNMTLGFQDESWRYLLLPIYLAAYTFGEEVYQIVINGQTGSIGGSRPVDWTKVWLVVAAIFIPALIAGLVGLVVTPVLCVAGVLFIGAIVGAFWLISTAQKIANPDEQSLQVNNLALWRK